MRQDGRGGVLGWGGHCLKDDRAGREVEADRARETDRPVFLWTRSRRSRARMGCKPMAM